MLTTETLTALDRSSSYLDLARNGRGRGWDYLLGTAIIIVLGSILSVVTLVAAERLLESIPANLPAMTATLASFIPQLLIVLTVVVLIHRRGWRTVITARPRLEPARIWRPAGNWAVIMVLVSIPCAILDPDGLRLGPPSWTGFAWAAGVALLLIPVQATAEELFFRGYLMQWASLATRRRWVLACISGTLFTVPHLANPELSGLTGAAVLLGPLPYFTFGGTFAWISINTGSIEAAIGAHVVNNVVLATVIGTSGSALESTTLITDTSPNYLLTVISSMVACALFIRTHTPHPDVDTILPPSEAP